MSMGLSLNIYHYAKCTLCGESIAQHADTCPHNRIQMIDAQRSCIRCPVCPKGRVEVNTDDYYECRECNTLFTTSGIHEGKRLKKSILFEERKDEAINVLILKEKGKGLFKFDRDMKKIEEEIERIESSRKSDGSDEED